jgi:hypothetical protein
MAELSANPALFEANFAIHLPKGMLVLMSAQDWLPNVLLVAAVRRRLQAGEILFHRDDRPRGLYLLERGEVRLTRSDPEGRDIILFRAQPGETFAEASLFSGAYHCDAVADVPSVVLLLPKATVLEAFAAVLLQTRSKDEAGTGASSCAYRASK